SGAGSVISLRGGSWVAIGEGTQAWNGSTLLAGGVPVKVVGGGYTYGAAGWTADSTASGYHVQDAAAFNAAMAKAGVTIDWNGNNPTAAVYGKPIPSSLTGLVVDILGAQPVASGDSMASLTVKTNGTIINGVVLSAGDVLAIWNEGLGADKKVGVYVGKNGLSATGFLPSGWSVRGPPAANDDGSFKLTFAANARLGVLDGLVGKTIFNTVAVEWNGKSFAADTLALTVTVNGTLSLAADADGMTFKGNTFGYRAAGSEVALMPDGKIILVKGTLFTKDGVMAKPTGGASGGSSDVYASGGRAWTVGTGPDAVVHYDGDIFNVSEVTGLDAAFSISAVTGANSSVSWMANSYHPALGLISGGDLLVTVDAFGIMTATAINGAVKTTQDVYDKDNPSVLRGHSINTYSREGLETSQYRIDAGCTLPPGMADGREGFVVAEGQSYVTNFSVTNHKIDVDADGNPVTAKDNGTVVSPDFTATRKAVIDGVTYESTLHASFEYDPAQKKDVFSRFGDTYTIDGVAATSLTRYMAGVGVILQGADGKLINLDFSTTATAHELSNPVIDTETNADGTANFALYTYTDAKNRSETLKVFTDTTNPTHTFSEYTGYNSDGKQITYLRTFTPTHSSVDMQLGMSATGVNVVRDGFAVVVTATDPASPGAANQQDKYRLFDFKDPVQQQSGQAGSFVPIQFGVLYQTVDGKVSTKNLSDLGVPEITGRVDDQYQKWAQTKAPDGNTYDGLLKSTLNGNSTQLSLSFSGIDKAGDTITAQVALSGTELGKITTDNLVSENIDITGGPAGGFYTGTTWHNSLINAIIRNPSGTITGFYDENYKKLLSFSQIEHGEVLQGTSAHFETNQATIQGWINSAVVAAISDVDANPQEAGKQSFSAADFNTEGISVVDGKVQVQLSADYKVSSAYDAASMPGLPKYGDGQFEGRIYLSANQGQPHILSSRFVGSDGVNTLTQSYNYSLAPNNTGAMSITMAESYVTSFTVDKLQSVSVATKDGAISGPNGTTASRVVRTYNNQGLLSLESYVGVNSSLFADGKAEVSYDYNMVLLDPRTGTKGSWTGTIVHTTIEEDGGHRSIDSTRVVDAYGEVIYSGITTTRIYGDLNTGKKETSTELNFKQPITIFENGSYKQTDVHISLDGQGTATTIERTDNVYDANHQLSSTVVLVDDGGTKYVAELRFFDASGRLIAKPEYAVDQYGNPIKDPVTGVSFVSDTEERFWSHESVRGAENILSFNDQAIVLVDGETRFRDADVSNLDKLNAIFSQNGLTAAQYFERGGTISDVYKTTWENFLLPDQVIILSFTTAEGYTKYVGYSQDFTTVLATYTMAPTGIVYNVVGKYISLLNDAGFVFDEKLNGYVLNKDGVAPATRVAINGFNFADGTWSVAEVAERTIGGVTRLVNTLTTHTSHIEDVGVLATVSRFIGRLFINWINAFRGLEGVSERYGYITSVSILLNNDIQEREYTLLSPTTASEAKVFNATRAVDTHYNAEGNAETTEYVIRNNETHQLATFSTVFDASWRMSDWQDNGFKIVSALTAVVAAVVVTIVTVGTDVPFLFAATAIPTGLFAAQAAWKGADCLQRGDYVGAILNYGMAVLTIAMVGIFAVRALAADFVLGEYLREAGVGILKWTLGGTLAGGGVGMGVELFRSGGDLNSINWWNVLGFTLSGAMIGMSIGCSIGSFAGQTLMGVLQRGFSVTVNTALSVRSVWSSMNNFQNGNFMGGVMDLAMAFSLAVSMLNESAGLNKAKSVEKLSPDEVAQLSPDKLASYNKSLNLPLEVPAGIAKTTVVLRTGLAMGTGWVLLNVAGTVQQNMLAGDSWYKNLSLQGMVMQFAFGFSIGLVIGYFNPRLGYNLYERNVFGTLSGYMMKPSSFVLAGLQSGASLAAFNSTFGLLFTSGKGSGIFGFFGGLFTGQGFEKSFNDSGLFQGDTMGQAIYDIWFNPNLNTDATKGDVNSAWEGVRGGFATGMFQGPLFGMAIPGAAIFEKGTLRDRIFSAWANEGPLEGVLKAIPGVSRIAENYLVKQLGMQITMFQYEAAGKLFGWIGKGIDSKVLGSRISKIEAGSITGWWTGFVVQKNTKGEQVGIFEYLLESGSMMLVPTHLAQRSAGSYPTERELRSNNSETRTSAALRVAAEIGKLNDRLTETDRVTLEQGAFESITRNSVLSADIQAKIAAKAGTFERTVAGTEYSVQLDQNFVKSFDAALGVRIATVIFNVDGKNYNAKDSMEAGGVIDKAIKNGSVEIDGKDIVLTEGVAREVLRQATVGLKPSQVADLMAKWGEQPGAQQDGAALQQLQAAQTEHTTKIADLKFERTTQEEQWKQVKVQQSAVMDALQKIPRQLATLFREAGVDGARNPFNALDGAVRGLQRDAENIDRALRLAEQKGDVSAVDRLKTQSADIHARIDRLSEVRTQAKSLDGQRSALNAEADVLALQRDNLQSAIIKTTTLIDHAEKTVIEYSTSLIISALKDRQTVFEAATFSAEATRAYLFYGEKFLDKNNVVIDVNGEKITLDYAMREQIINNVRAATESKAARITQGSESTSQEAVNAYLKVGEEFLTGKDVTIKIGDREVTLNLDQRKAVAALVRESTRKIPQGITPEAVQAYLSNSEQFMKDGKVTVKDATITLDTAACKAVKDFVTGAAERAVAREASDFRSYQRNQVQKALDRYERTTEATTRELNDARDNKREAIERHDVAGEKRWGDIERSLERSRVEDLRQLQSAIVSHERGFIVPKDARVISMTLELMAVTIELNDKNKTQLTMSDLSLQELRDVGIKLEGFKFRIGEDGKPVMSIVMIGRDGNPTSRDYALTSSDIAALYTDKAAFSKLRDAYRKAWAEKKEVDISFKGHIEALVNAFKNIFPGHAGESWTIYQGKATAVDIISSRSTQPREFMLVLQMQQLMGGEIASKLSDRILGNKGMYTSTGDGSPIKMSLPELDALHEYLTSKNFVKNGKVDLDLLRDFMTETGTDNQAEVTKMLDALGYAERDSKPAAGQVVITPGDVTRRAELLNAHMAEVQAYHALKLPPEFEQALQARQADQVPIKAEYKKIDNQIAVIDESLKKAPEDATLLAQRQQLVQDRAVVQERERNASVSMLSDAQSSIINQLKAGNEEVAYKMLNDFVGLSMTAALGWQLRVGQREMVSAMLRGESVGYAMAGGKTIAAVVDCILHRVLLGDSARLEILVGNGDTPNYSTASKPGQMLARYMGMDIVDVSQLYMMHDTKGIIKAYNDPNVIVAVDPTTRAHMRNAAVIEQNGGLSAALNSVNVVVVDEIHMWTLTRTGAVIGGGGKPPTMEQVEKMGRLAELFKEHYTDLTSAGKPDSSQVHGGFEVRRVKTMTDALEFLGSSEKIVLLVGQGTNIEVQMTQSAADFLIAKDYTPLEIVSVLRGVMSEGGSGGISIVKMKIDGKDTEKVKPVGNKGVEYDMVLSDINYQLGLALRTGWERAAAGELKGRTIEEFAQSATETSDSSIQTSLTAIYNNLGPKMVGISGTIFGLQQLIQTRTDSKIYNISSERVDTKDFEMMNPDALKAHVKAALENKDMNGLLMVAKTKNSLDAITNAVRDVLRENPVLAGKYEVFEYTGNQARWEQGGEFKLRPLEKDQTISAVANGSTFAEKTAKNRIIIANEMGMTGVDYQGKFTEIIFDAHLMSETDLAQTIKRVGRLIEGKPGERWAEHRFIVGHRESYKSELSHFLANEQFVAAAEALWRGDTGNKYMKNDTAIKLLDIVKRGGTLDQKQMVEFVSKVQDINDINGAVRFAVRDAMRDKMLLNPLRTLLETLPDGAARDLVKVKLNEALNQRTGSADIVLREMTPEYAGDVMHEMFKSCYSEAMKVFGELRSVREGSSGEMISLHIQDLKAADNAYRAIKVTTGSLDKTRSITEFVGALKAMTDYIMPVLGKTDYAYETSAVQAKASVDQTVVEARRQGVDNTAADMLNKKLGNSVAGEGGANPVTAYATRDAGGQLRFTQRGAAFAGAYLKLFGAGSSASAAKNNDEAQALANLFSVRHSQYVQAPAQNAIKITENSQAITKMQQELDVLLTQPSNRATTRAIQQIQATILQTQQQNIALSAQTQTATKQAPAFEVAAAAAARLAEGTGDDVQRAEDARSVADFMMAQGIDFNRAVQVGTMLPSLPAGQAGTPAQVIPTIVQVDQLLTVRENPSVRAVDASAKPRIPSPVAVVQARIELARLQSIPREEVTSGQKRMERELSRMLNNYDIVINYYDGSTTAGARMIPALFARMKSEIALGVQVPVIGQIVRFFNPGLSASRQVKIADIRTMIDSTDPAAIAAAASVLSGRTVAIADVRALLDNAGRSATLQKYIERTPVASIKGQASRNSVFDLVRNTDRRLIVRLQDFVLLKVVKMDPHGHRYMQSLMSRYDLNADQALDALDSRLGVWLKSSSKDLEVVAIKNSNDSEAVKAEKLITLAVSRMGATLEKDGVTVAAVVDASPVSAGTVNVSIAKKALKTAQTVLHQAVTAAQQTAAEAKTMEKTKASETEKLSAISKSRKVQEDTRTSIQTDITQLHQRVTDLNSSFTADTAELNDLLNISLRDRTSEQKTRIVWLISHTQSLKSEAQNVETSLRQLNERIAAVDKQLAELTKQATAYQKAVEKLRADIAYANSESVTQLTAREQAGVAKAQSALSMAQDELSIAQSRIARTAEVQSYVTAVGTLEAVALTRPDIMSTEVVSSVLTAGTAAGMNSVVLEAVCRVLNQSATNILVPETARLAARKALFDLSKLEKLDDDGRTLAGQVYARAKAGENVQSIPVWTRRDTVNSVAVGIAATGFAVVVGLTVVGLPLASLVTPFVMQMGLSA
ncbi:MAG: hypothetical protein WCG51_00070, partial [Elusimicrobiota bacterium]